VRNFETANQRVQRGDEAGTPVWMLVCELCVVITEEEKRNDEW
jgi:hypothetical protein